MIAAVDVHYFDTGARAACVVFGHWSDPRAACEYVAELPPAAAYVSGEFFRRELPCVLEVLRRVPSLPDTIVVDGYVWLDQHAAPGLGAHLWESLGRRAAVVGVAKNPRKQAQAALPVLRGTSAKPLLVSAVGVTPEEAARGVRQMHGEHRIPDLLRRVDRLARGHALPDAST